MKSTEVWIAGTVRRIRNEKEAYLGFNHTDYWLLFDYYCWEVNPTDPDQVGAKDYDYFEKYFKARQPGEISNILRDIKSKLV